MKGSIEPVNGCHILEGASFARNTDTLEVYGTS